MQEQRSFEEIKINTHDYMESFEQLLDSKILLNRITQQHSKNQPKYQLHHKYGLYHQEAVDIYTCSIINGLEEQEDHVMLLRYELEELTDHRHQLFY